MSKYDRIAAAIEGETDPAVVGDRLRGYSARDITSVLAAEEPGGGSQPLRHEVIPITDDDIDTPTGRAPIITLEPGEWLLASWRVVTEAFDDSAIFANSGATVLAPAGVAVSTFAIDDSLSCVDLTTDNALGGLIGPDPASSPQSAFVNAMMPLVSPDTVAVDIELDFCADQPATGDGTTGALEQHLLILSAP